MKDDTLANAITYIFLLRVKSFPKIYVTLCPSKWYHSPPLAHALILRNDYRSYELNKTIIPLALAGIKVVITNATAKRL